MATRVRLVALTALIPRLLSVAVAVGGAHSLGLMDSGPTRTRPSTWGSIKSQFGK